jgi:MFS family permease
MTDSGLDISPVGSNIIKLIPLYVAISILGLTLGLTLPVLALAMNKVGASVTLVGLNTLLANLAALIASALTPVAITRIGGKRTITWGLLFAGITLALLGIAVDIPAFFVFRIINCFIFGVIFVATETFVISMSDPDRRARNMGIYGMAMAAGAALGPIFGFTLFERSTELPFISGGVVCVVSIIVFALFFRPEKLYEDKSKSILSPLTIALPLGAAVIFGFIFEGIISLMPLYLQDINFPPRAMGYIITSFELGAISLQYPLCFLADKFGKKGYLNIVYFLTGIGFFAVPMFSTLQIIIFLSFVIGGLISSIYPVGMAIAGDDVKKGDYPQVAAYMCIGFSVGAMAGPFILSVAMDRFGYEFLFYVSGAVLIALSIQPLWKVFSRSWQDL